MRLLIVDDDALFRETLAQNLEDDGFEVDQAADGPTALAGLERGEAPDAVILDWNMPGMNGLQVLRAMREDGLATPVLFLTGHSDQIFEESALDGGAADFVDKSRSYSILRKRLDLILGARRGAPADLAEALGDALNIGRLTLHGDSKRAHWDGREVDLTVSEFDIVHLLAGRAGRDVRFREIYDVVHGKGFWAGQGEDGYRTNVRTFIKRIRRKFRDVDPGFEAIETYTGFGYRWTADEGG